MILILAYFLYTQTTSIRTNEIHASGLNVLSYEEVACAADAGVISVACDISFIITDGGADNNEDQITMADGSYIGQTKIICYKTNTDGADSFEVFLTLSGGASLVFTSIEHGAILVFDGTSWNIVGEHGIGVP